ncbi:MAG: YlmH/Sll1252 family protein [Clostridiales bacterium]|nr:YlmH/Sll1252 family protein [Clostridiales bacterium]
MEIIKKRFVELAQRAKDKHYNNYSEFLNLEEQSILESTISASEYKLFGGYNTAERRVAGFGEDCATEDFPISIIKIEPLAPKFAEKLSHRDFLGAAMGLGLRREMMGDIIVSDNTAELFCLDSVAEFILNNLDMVRRTNVKCSIEPELPDSIQPAPAESKDIVSSPRLDAVVAAVYNCSRSDAKELLAAGKVFVNSSVCVNGAYNLKESDIISVRGKGRFMFGNIGEATKKTDFT